MLNATLKVVIVGDSRVGKSQLCRRVTNRSFEVYSTIFILGVVMMMMMMMMLMTERAMMIMMMIIVQAFLYVISLSIFLFYSIAFFRINW
jgi:ABC-type phosphate/phosphonate transport system ATPase subunit